MISLILQTLGLSTESNDHRKSMGGQSQASINDEELSVGQDEAAKSGRKADGKQLASSQTENVMTTENERIFEEYWKEQIIPEFRIKALTKLFSTFLRCSPEINFFFNNYWIKELQSRNIAAVDPTKQLPHSLKDIRRRIDRSVYGDSLDGFIAEVESCFQNAIVNEHVSAPIKQAAMRLVDAFRAQINQFKQSQIRVATKSFSRASAKPDSTVAALIEKTNSEKLRRALQPSSATLLVVPAVLVDHWIVSYIYFNWSLPKICLPNSSLLPFCTYSTCRSN